MAIVNFLLLSLLATPLRTKFPQQRAFGVIFDMDGTLIQPCIDFAEMRRRIYDVASEDLGRPVLQGDVIKLFPSLSPSGQAKANEIFAEIEAKAKKDMKIMPGMFELCDFLDENRINRALLTRNVVDSVDYMYDNFMKTKGMRKFDPQVARDSLDERGNIIIAKPQPDAIHYICRQWNCSPSQVIMVGDSDKDDIVAGNRAGCGATVHLKTGIDNDSGNGGESDTFERKPTLEISTLSELQLILEEHHSPTMAT